MSLRPGEVFAGYTVERELGSGGMGSVYLARHPRLPRHDALKLLKPELCADPAFVGRFEREAETVAQLDHPNIVSVHDRGSQDGQLWISMRFIDGTNAEKALDETPNGMPPERAVRIVGRVAAALDYAHRHQLLHRDVKPANILLAGGGGMDGDDGDDEERVYLSDFGVAKAIGEAAAHVASLTSTGSVVATLDYASPEQIKGQSLDHRSDIYALGCVLYKLLTGSVPYPGESVAARVYGHLNNAPPKPSVRVPGLPPGLDVVVATSMAKEPDDRYPTCRAMAVAGKAALAAGANFVPPPAQRAAGSDPYGEGAPTTLIRTTPVSGDVPSTSEGWSLGALGGPWRFATGTMTPRPGASGSTGPQATPPYSTGPRTIPPPSSTGPGTIPPPSSTGPHTVPPGATGPRPDPRGGAPSAMPAQPAAWLMRPESSLGSPGADVTGPQQFSSGPPPRGGHRAGPGDGSGVAPAPGSAAPPDGRGMSRQRLWLVIGGVVVAVAVIVTAIILIVRGQSGSPSVPASTGSPSGSASGSTGPSSGIGSTTASFGETLGSAIPGLPHSAPLPDSTLVSSRNVNGSVSMVALDTDATTDTATSSVASTPITTGRSGPQYPVLSPDRGTIAYAQATPQGTDLRIAAADGSGDTSLASILPPDCDSVSRPAWNPVQPTTFALVCFAADGSRSLRLVDIDTGEVLTTLTVEHPYFDDVAFSPDGRSVTYWAYDDAASGGGAIYTQAVDGDTPGFMVTSGAGTDADPVYSPDGSEIAFRRATSEGRAQIIVTGSDGASPEREITDGSSADQDPTWSPDGIEIAYKSDRPGTSGTAGNQIWIVAATDGSAPRELAGLEGTADGAPAWGAR